MRKIKIVPVVWATVCFQRRYCCRVTICDSICGLATSRDDGVMSEYLTTEIDNNCRRCVTIVEAID